MLSGNARGLRQDQHKALAAYGSGQFKRHPFPATVILQAARRYFRFTLSIRDVEELMAEGGVEVSREAIRFPAIKFGPLMVANLRWARSRPTSRWHLDQVVVQNGGWRRAT